MEERVNVVVTQRGYDIIGIKTFHKTEDVFEYGVKELLRILKTCDNPYGGDFQTQLYETMSYENKFMNFAG
jgi:hypothetical protein